jgi:hypothetical protein
MLLTEAHGELATEELSAHKLSALSQVTLPTILVQEWIDKDGRVSFIKLNWSTRHTYILNMASQELPTSLNSSGM